MTPIAATPLSNLHVAIPARRDRFGYLHAGCSCGWEGPSSAHPADLAGDYRAHDLEVGERS
jgi:hypothetical protein